MGNCIRKESTTQWGGEDWSSFTSNSSLHNSADKNGRILEEIVLSSAAPPAAIHEVKIKISKKQLEQLFKEAPAHEQLLAQLLDAADQSPWMPALQTIPE